MRILRNFFIANCLLLTDHFLQAQQSVTIGNGNELYFTDNGQIRSLDDAHRILFRRADNTLEFREFGRILFSPGSVGNETGKMVLTSDGLLGIGTTSPSAPLTLLTTNTNTFANIASFKNEAATNTWMYVANNNGQANLGVGGARPHAYLWSSTGKFFIGDEGNPTLLIDGMANGNVSIGTSDSKGYKLAVNGSAIFTKVVVKPYPWPDYVFHANYRLRPLNEVEEYIKQYGHLPEVPTAEEVEKNGLDVGDNQATLLKKIEELTLYVIEQNKKQQELNRKVNVLQEDNERLKKLLQSSGEVNNNVPSKF
jgi:hypothetical protein